MIEDFIVRQFQINLLERDKNPELSFSNLKYLYDYSTLCRIVDKMSMKGSFQKWIYGNPLPESISEIANTNINVTSKKLRNEINWILLSIREYKDKIQEFVEFKETFEIALIKGEYDRAEEILNTIEKNISYSLWSVENRFLLIELKKGLKENTGFLNNINSHNNQPFIRCLSHFYSIKAEKELSVNRYEVSLFKFLIPLVENGNNADADYYVFKLNPFLRKTYAHLSEILGFENFNSVIDKYLSLLRVFQLLIIQMSDDDKDLKEFVKNRINYLGKKVNDKNIRTIQSVVDSECENISLTTEDSLYISILDNYTSGDYHHCRERIERIFDTNPLIIELYPIYIKALIQLGEQNTYGNEDSYQRQILDALYNLYSKETDPAQSKILLKKITYNLSMIPNLSYFIANVIKQEIENDTSFEDLSIALTSFINPNLSKLHSDPLKFLTALSDQVPHSSTTNLFVSLALNNINTYSNDDIDALRLKFYTALNYQNNGKYVDASNIWESLIYKELLGFQTEAILINLFTCKANLEELDFCIDLYVNYYFINKYLTHRLNVDLVKNQIKIAKFKNIKYDVKLPLFFYLTNSEGYDIHTAYECFLLSQDCEKPSDLLTNDVKYDRNLLFFMKNVCSLDTFKHSPFITSTKSKLNERIKICQKLRELDADNEDYYKEEETLLSNRLIIQKGLQEIDESKIYVNQDNIILNELKELKSTFNRYVSIAQLTAEEEGISIINLGSEDVINISIQQKESKDLEFSKDPQYDIFKELFFEIRDKFLYSKYGLKLNLSTRIRHGVFEGELRSEFSLLHLITEKEKALDTYKKNTYWDAFIKSYNNDKIQRTFYDLMSNFSKKIDGLIYDEILSRFLLIKTEKENKDGWLDYEFSETSLQVQYSLFYKKIIDYSGFVNLIFNDLWDRTRDNLQTIQDSIRFEFRDRFFEAIQILENRLNQEKINTPEELIRNLTEIKTRVENKLNKIASWFSITDTKISDFEFNKIVEVCHESLQSYDAAKQLNLEKDISFSEMIKGKYYTHMVYLLRIFLQNILDYTHEDIANATLTVKSENGELNIRIENELREDESLEELRRTIQIEYDISKSQLDKSSGLYKALSSVKTNFDDESNEMKLDIIDHKFCVFIKLNVNKLLA
ncbi:MAG: hypothetical protein J5I67_01160 [Ignavibacterium album]|nr:hypothetical protein [Ignavibacterium album]